MPRPKSLLPKVSIDSALKSHTCQHSSSHIVSKGDRRLKLKVKGSYEHFCIACALQIIDSDIKTLQELRRQLTGSD